MVPKNQKRKGVTMKVIIPEKNSFENTTVSSFFKRYQVTKLLKKSNFYKENGYSCSLLFQFLLILAFTGKNLYNYLKTESSFLAKDSVYRFLNNYRYNWKKFLLLLSSSVINKHLCSLTSKDRVNVFIIDDSLYSRSRSKSVELLARVWDHVDNRYVKGFRMLTLGWSDGNTFIPLAFNLLSSANQKNRLNEAKQIDKRTNGYQRRKEAVSKSTDALIALIKEARLYMVPASYVLFDSWFAFPVVMRNILQEGLHCICMLKKTPNILYQYEGKKVALKTIYASVKKKRGKAKILSSVIVGIGHNEDGPVMAKIVFVRDRTRKKDWLALLSTDIDLEDEEIVRIYGKRWSIEVFFKMSKSYLRLAKEFQCRSYDAMVSHTTIVFVRYIILSLESRSANDPRSFGAIFYYCCDEIRDLTLTESLQLITALFFATLQKGFQLSDEELTRMITYFIGSLPLFFKERLQFS